CSSRRTRERSSAGRPTGWWRRSATPSPRAASRGNPSPPPSTAFENFVTASRPRRRPAAEGFEKGLDFGAGGEGVLGAPLRAAESRGGAGERDRLLEGAAGREAHRQRAVEGIAGGRGIDRRDGERGIV